MRRMNGVCGTALIVLAWGSSICSAQSPFDGTWRPDPQRPPADRKPDVFQLANGVYECQTCQPPYKVAADGAEHPISGNPRFDSLRVRLVDARTVKRVARKAGAVVIDATMTVAADLKSMTDRQVITDAGPRPIDFTSQFRRVTAGAAGAHAVSGSWQLIESDLTNHDEDTVYEVHGDVLSMSDRMGRSFVAKLDGTDAPYRGDPQFTTVSVKWLDSRTLEETDKKSGEVIKITRWSLDADDKTIHARFDDQHGHVEKQTGHRIK